MRLGLVINPTAGGAKGEKVGQQVRDRLAQTENSVLELSAGSLEAARENCQRAINEGIIDVLIVVGGDGMAHLGVNVCAEKNVSLAIVPAGTGNDSAGILGMPLDDPIRAIELILENLDDPKRIDALSIVHGDNHTWAFGTASAGFDALVNRRANAMSWPNGPSRYYLAMLLELARFKPITYKATIDGEAKEFEAMLCVVSNSGVFGGGMLVVPDASVQDDLLDLLIVKRMTRQKLVAIFPRVYKGTHVSDPAVEILRAKQIFIEAEGMPIYSDGEYVGQAPFRATIVPSCLSVIAPAL
ncbi:MAG: diacylglycerol/lipid kinase family protein [Actinomycetota bacterium]